MPAQDARGAAEARLPESVRDHRDRLAAGPHHFFRPEESAERRLQTERGKIIPGNEQPVRALDLARLAHIERRHPKGEDLAKRTQPLPQILIFEPRHAHIDAGVGARFHSIQAARSGHTRQRLKDPHLNPGKHDGVHADSGAHRNDDDGGERGRPHDHSKRVAHVADHSLFLDPCGGPRHVAHLARDVTRERAVLLQLRGERRLH